MLVGMWVVVKYEGEKFIGNVLGKRNGEFQVHCLDKPFGIREPQSYEKVDPRTGPPFYTDVYEASVTPKPVKIGRKYFFQY